MVSNINLYLVMDINLIYLVIYVMADSLGSAQEIEFYIELLVLNNRRPRLLTIIPGVYNQILIDIWDHL